MNTTESELKNLSMKQRFLLLPRDQQQKFINETPEPELEALLNSWQWEARPKQLAPKGDWHCWLILAGRSWGKTRTASEFIVNEVKQGRATQVALIGRTSSDVHDVMLNNPRSGIIKVAELRGLQIAKYNRTKGHITFTNGATISSYFATEPDKLRGPEHDLGWLDELATFPETTASKEYGSAYDNFLMGLRLGDNPRYIATTTPRGTKFLRDLVDKPTTHVTSGPSFENTSLPQAFIDDMLATYDGTRRGRQELYAEILTDVEGALWNGDSFKYVDQSSVPTFDRIVIACDPSTTTNQGSDFTAIAVAGATEKEGKQQFYLLHTEALKVSPNEWATRINHLFNQFGADLVVVETNQGGDMVESTLRQVNQNLPIKRIHAKRGKALRAEPVSLLYERGQVWHVGTHDEAEDQMTQFPSKSLPNDDLVDAVVYSLTELSHLEPIEEETPFMTFRRPKF